MVQFIGDYVLKRCKLMKPKSTLAGIFLTSTLAVSPAIADYQSGYQWAVKNSPDSFSMCQEQFGISEEEDGCNDYVQKALNDAPKKFGPHDCNEGCDGYKAGYQWAEENSISDVYDCESVSSSFTEGCQSFVNDN